VFFRFGVLIFAKKYPAMIQRIQSLYLFVASVMMLMLFFFPIADFWGEISYRLSITAFGDFSVEATSPFSGYFTWPLLAFTLVLIILPVVALILFKYRRKQLVLIRLSLAFLIVFLILVFFYYIPTIEGRVGIQADYLSPKGMFFPLAALVFIILAQRGVMKDERIIRSMDRIR